MSIEIEKGIIEKTKIYLCYIEDRLWTYFQGAIKYRGYIPTDEGCRKCEFDIHSLISCHIEYRNNFVPQLMGTVIQAENGSEICIKQSLQPFTKIFMVIWLVGMSLISVLIWLAVKIPYPFLAVIGGYILMILGFWFEAGNTKKLFENLLKNTLRPTE